MKPENLKAQVHLWISPFRATSTKFRFAVDSGACGAPLTGVSSCTGALLSALDRWRLGRWCSSTAFLQPSRCYPRLSSSGRGRGVLIGSTSTSKPASLGCCSGIAAVLALLRLMVPHTLALLRSALGRLVHRWYLMYQRCSWRY